MVQARECGWCGKTEDEAKRLFPGPTIFICDRCVDAMSGAVRTEDAGAAEAVRDEIDRAVQESFRKMVKQIKLGPLQDTYQRLVRVKFSEEDADGPSFGEIFQEFKKGVEAEVAADDYQTRYDLAIAYHEMGLSDDAIREMLQSLRGSLRQQDYDRAGQAIGAFLYMHDDAAHAITGIYRALAESGMKPPRTEKK